MSLKLNKTIGIKKFKKTFVKEEESYDSNNKAEKLKVILDKNDTSPRALTKKKILNELHIDKLPDDLYLSTMTLICSIGTDINLENFAKYVDLKNDKILSVSYGVVGNVLTNRSLINRKRNPKKEKKSREKFYNQVTTCVIIPSKEKPVNVKLFSNGSIQMTGCKNIEHALDTIEQLYNELKIVKAVIDKKQKKIIEKPFVVDANKLSFEYISRFKVVMINSNFNVEFSIDRQKLQNLMKKDGHDSSLDTNRHACVNVKYYHPDKEISVFVFEKGSIIITGAKNCIQIRDAYDFINKYLYANYNSIVKVDNATSPSILKLLEKN